MQQRKEPIRICVGCNEHKPKRELIRIIKNKEEQIFLDKTGKMAGRGAYVCDNAECLRKARKSRRIERSFKMKIPQQIYDNLEKEMNSNDE